MTEHNPYILRIELEDFENETRYAEYQSFTVADAWNNCNGLGPSSTQIIRPVIYRLSVKFEVNLMKN
jgi:hypothetical protein